MCLNAGLCKWPGEGGGGWGSEIFLTATMDSLSVQWWGGEGVFLLLLVDLLLLWERVFLFPLTPPVLRCVPLYDP